MHTTDRRLGKTVPWLWLTVAQNRMANLLLAFRGRNRFGGGGQAAEDIARATARECLEPMLEAACARLANILRKAFDIAAERALITGTSLLPT